MNKRTGILLSLLLGGITLYARDSTRWDYSLKGIDIKVGRAHIHTPVAQSVAVLKNSAPDYAREDFDYSDVRLIDGVQGNFPVRIQAAAVFSNNRSALNYLVSRKELRFGIGYEVQPFNASMKKLTNIGYSGHPLLATTTYMKYRYQSQYVEIGYQLSSRSFLKYFAVYAGMNASFGLNSYGSIEIIDYWNRPIGEEEYQELPIHGTFMSAYANLGVKYNASCELNLFLQAEQGMNFYGGAAKGTAWLSGFAIGMRYKIIDEQDRPQYHDLMRYW